MILFPCEAPFCGGMAKVAVPPARSGFTVTCPVCGKEYPLSSEVAARLGMAEDLRAAIRRARPILSGMSVGVKTGDREVKIPYNLLVGSLPAEMAFAGVGGNRRFLFLDDEERNADSRGGKKR